VTGEGDARLSEPDTREEVGAVTDGAYLQVRDLTKRFGGTVACDHIDLDIAEGEFFTIVGPSGSGKTTLLRILTGMLPPTSGRITLRDHDITRVPPQKRPTCLVFQGLALFPHRTVGQNIEFPLKVRGVKPRERRARARDLLELLRLPPDRFYTRNVQECSGGERQRVAIARALAYDPEILFFDEPLSAIDYQLRKVLQRELKDIHEETGRTFVYVTHSLEEALVMSDRLGIMRNGAMVQIGTPEEIYHRPAEKAVSEFMGEVNVFPVRRVGTSEYRCDDLDVTLRHTAGEELEDGYIVVRPERIRFVSSRDEAANALSGTVRNFYAMGSRIQYRVDVGPLHLTVERLADEPMIPLHADVLVGWDADAGWTVSR
jgi:spermidine/putrescine transport system ATP-binding protein